MENSPLPSPVSPQSSAAAILLCAGKGSRMGDDSINKVCCDCAGVPVIRRIIANMRAGGISRFVVVVGHQAESVMRVLDGEDGVIYAYQKDQKGTGHAALCGLKVLSGIGYAGPVVVSMGDKIASVSVIRDLLRKAGTAKAIVGVQPRAANPHGGHVMLSEGGVCGIVEFADAARMALAGVRAEDRAQRIEALGLTGKKAQRVLEQAAQGAVAGETTLAGRVFTAADVLATPYVNASLYCFDAAAVTAALAACRSDNAQNEIYLTDTIAFFARTKDVTHYEVTSRDDLVTYSTRPELRLMSQGFLKTTRQMAAAIEGGAWRARLADLYGEDAVPRQETRYRNILSAFIAHFGDRKAVIARAGGRVNLMGRHIEHRGGGVNVFATGCDTVIVAAPRTDGCVNIADLDPAYPAVSFSIGETLALGPATSWLDYLAAAPVKEALKARQGHWSNYVKAAVLRFQMATDMPLCGMDIICSGDIPVAAGLSSSSSIVVAVAEAIVALNALNIPTARFVELCGEGEWFVGSRGGAGDHAAIVCGAKDRITHLGFMPFTIGKAVPFSPRYALVVANSQEQAKKSEGARDRFNAQVATYEFALMLIRRAFPERTIRYFRDLSRIRPEREAYHLVRALPETVTRADLVRMLPESGAALDALFATHADPGTYSLRAVALYGMSECARADLFMDVLQSGDYARLGAMMKTSHDGDRLGAKPFTDAYLATCAEENRPLALESGSYGCSTPRIDALCDLINAQPGVLGCQLVGAGLGGCVVALVEKAAAQDVIGTVNRAYYDAHGLQRAAAVFSPASGASVFFS